MLFVSLAVMSGLTRLRGIVLLEKIPVRSNVLMPVSELTFWFGSC